jgi:hypothetical protein
VAGKAADGEGKAKVPADGHFTKDRSKESPFANICAKLKRLWPFLWPVGHPWLQFIVIFSLGLLAAGRVVNLLVPIYYKTVLDDLTDLAVGNGSLPVTDVSLYVFMRVLQVRHC